MGEIKQKKPPKYRIFELDFVRGVLIIGMLIGHVNNYWHIPHYELTYWWTPIGVSLFFFLSGITATLSRRHTKQLLLAIVIVTVLDLLTFLFHKVTNIELDSLHTYGILLLLSIFAFCFGVIRKLPPKVYLLLCAVVIIVSCAVYGDWFNMIEREPSVPLIEQYIQLMLRYFNIIQPAVFLIGTLIGRAYYKNKHSPLVLGYLNNNKFCKPVLWFGRHSLIIFIVQIFAIPSVYLLVSLFI